MDINLLRELSAQVVSEIEALPFPRVENNKEGVRVGLQLNQLLGKALAIFKELERELDAEQIPQLADDKDVSPGV